ncbi:hypothetical protein, partial [Bradyrhizobium sp.]|uniref:hypothetical protein n=1 Tax=Bradyrhizobium sp. TaxID=376 RepID=UPI003C7170D9
MADHHRQVSAVVPQAMANGLGAAGSFPALATHRASEQAPNSPVIALLPALVVRLIFRFIRTTQHAAVHANQFKRLNTVSLSGTYVE